MEEERAAAERRAALVLLLAFGDTAVLLQCCCSGQSGRRLCSKIEAAVQGVVWAAHAIHTKEVRERLGSSFGCDVC